MLCRNILPTSGAKKTNEINRTSEVAPDNATYILEHRADFQAAIAAPIANTTNNGLKSGKNGKPPLLGNAS